MEFFHLSKMSHGQNIGFEGIGDYLEKVSRVIESLSGCEAIRGSAADAEINRLIVCSSCIFILLTSQEEFNIFPY